ncbi:hypothetical protein JCM5350_002815 [Sporobolomyces pararoseus]
MSPSLVFALTLVSSAFALVPFTGGSLDVANLAVNVDMTDVEIYDAWMRMGDMLIASGENQNVALVACKEVCFDWNLNAVACGYPDHTQSQLIACMCNQQNINTMPPCTDCLANQNSKPEYRQQTQNFLDFCDTLNYSLKNATKSSIFFDDVSSTSADPPLATATLSSSASSTVSDEAILGGGLGRLTLSSDLLSAATQALSSSTPAKTGIAATSTSISNQGEAKVTPKAENGTERLEGDSAGSVAAQETGKESGSRLVDI